MLNYLLRRLFVHKGLSKLVTRDHLLKLYGLSLFLLHLRCFGRPLLQDDLVLLLLGGLLQHSVLLLVGLALLVIKAPVRSCPCPSDTVQ